MSEKLPEWKARPGIVDWRENVGQSVQRGADGKAYAVPNLPFEWWLDKAGNLVAVPVMTTRNPGEAEDPHRFRNFIQRKMVRDGWMPWTFALAEEQTPHLVAGRSQTQWEEYREEQVINRREAHQEFSQKFESAWRDKYEKEATNIATAVAKAMIEADEFREKRATERAAEKKSTRSKKTSNE